MTIRSISRRLAAVALTSAAALALTAGGASASVGADTGATDCQWSGAALRVICSVPDGTSKVGDNCQWSGAALRVICSVPEVEGVAAGQAPAPAPQTLQPAPTPQAVQAPQPTLPLAGGGRGDDGDHRDHGGGGDDHRGHGGGDDGPEDD